ncbi:MAG: aminotransferase class I/II-fold pyridoxal phosphate-dependent enzyme [Rhodothermales bacterium]
MTTFQPFEMERLMSEWEHAVEYNLSESGVHPVSLRELLGDAGRWDALLDTELNYPQVNGTVALRERIAALYPGATPDNVLVTVGCAEANFITLQTLVAPGEDVVVMLPNYLQIWGMAHNFGLQIKAFHLREERGWAPDLEALDQAVTEKTKLIAVCNPNNPTGYILTEAEMDAVVAAAERVGAWLLADEVYSGAEQWTDTQTPSFWGRYDKVLALNSLSKAYGLPGLRVGWVVGPAPTVADIWRRHEYTTISTTMLANKLGALALSSEVRPRLIERTRRYVRRGFSILDTWLKSHGDLFTFVPPQAAAIAFVRYHLDVNSTELVDRLRHEHSVLIVPGDHVGLDHHVRISFGPPADYLQAGLARIHALMTVLQAGA